MAIAVDNAGEAATFFQHQQKNLAAAEADTAFKNIVKILGGFFALDDCTEGTKLLLEKFRTDAKIAKLNDRLRDLDGQVAFYEALANEMEKDEEHHYSDGKIGRARAKAAKYAQKKQKYYPALEKLTVTQNNDIEER